LSEPPIEELNYARAQRVALRPPGLVIGGIGFLVYAALALLGAFVCIAPYFWNGEDVPPIWLRVLGGAFGAIFLRRAAVTLKQLVNWYSLKWHR
jgi:hypothetical protein